MLTAGLVCPQVSLLFDNNGTVLFAMFMAVWGEFCISMQHCFCMYFLYSDSCLRFIIHTDTNMKSTHLNMWLSTICGYSVHHVQSSIFCASNLFYPTAWMFFYDHWDVHCQGDATSLWKPSPHGYSHLNQSRPSGCGGGRAVIHKNT